MANYRWVNDPPIRQVESAAFGGFIAHMRQSLATWGGNIENQNKVLDLMGHCLEDEECRFYAYIIDGAPAALMVMSGGMAKKLDELVGHPGAEGAGSIMVEHAVNLAGGNLSLDSLNTASTNFWRDSMGFERTGDLNVPGEVGSCKMRLQALRSDKWVRVANRWRLKKYHDQGLSLYSETY